MNLSFLKKDHANEKLKHQNLNAIDFKEFQFDQDEIEFSKYEETKDPLTRPKVSKYEPYNKNIKGFIKAHKPKLSNNE